MSALGPNLTPAGLDNDGNRLINVADPVNPQDGATKAFASNASNLSSGTIGPAVKGGGFPVATSWRTTWDMTGLKDLGAFTVSAALALSSATAAAVLWGRTRATLIGDGNSAHTVTVDGTALAGYNYAPGATNLVTLENVGGYRQWSCVPTAGALI